MKNFIFCAVQVKSKIVAFPKNTSAEVKYFALESKKVLTKNPFKKYKKALNLYLKKKKKKKFYIQY